MATISTDEVKRYLQLYGDRDREFFDLVERRAVLQLRAYAPSSAQLDGMPHSPGFVSDRTGNIVEQLEELDIELNAKKMDLRALYHEIDEYIGQIKAARRRGWPDRRAVLQMRYLDLADWSMITTMLFGQRGDFEDRRESYLRRTHRLHMTALLELAELTIQEMDSNGSDKKWRP